ncbi:MAG: ATP-dependent RNA helicase [Fibrobacteraceae bacterium]|nr:ATP-dependent RNA helicase [Fibrobacteraceae bacterium]
MVQHFNDLALAADKERLLCAIEGGGNILVEAPTGSGKSLYIPWLVHQQKKEKIVVLQPRRLAALGLAQFASKLLTKEDPSEKCGQTIGYQFRQESCKSEKTQILFQTYGNFLQELLHGKMDAQWIVFDEFHERSADMDLLFAYFAALKKENFQSGFQQKIPRLIIMSAKLNRAEMEKALNVKCLELGTPLYPVQILNQDKTAGFSLEQEVVKALRNLYRNNIWGTTLVFLPGKYEISRCRNAAEEAFGTNYQKEDTPTYLDIYGGQEREIQKQIFEESSKPRIIFTTNIAETSITVPNVTGVIDSGIERIAEYDDSERTQVLRTVKISQQNAIQRSGRAGRTQQGACIRLWSKEEEQHMPQGIVPQVTQIEPSLFLLQKSLLESFGRECFGNSSEVHPSLLLPTPIPPEREKVSNKLLNQLKMWNNGAITELGKQIALTPLSDISLSLILATQSQISETTLMVMSWIHAGTEYAQKSKMPLNLILMGQEKPKEVLFTYNQLKDYCKKKNIAPAENNNSSTIQILLQAYPHRLATPYGKGGDNTVSYKLENSNILRLQNAEPPYALLALNTLRTNGNELKVSMYLPVEKEMLQGNNTSVRYELCWKNKGERFVGLEICEENDREISRKEVPTQEASPKALSQLKELTVAAWQEKFDKDNSGTPFITDKVKEALCKMRLASKLYPEFRLPEFNQEDLELIFDDFASGYFLLKDMTEERYMKSIEDYFGKSMLNWLHKTFPDHFEFPNKKKARYIYQEVACEDGMGEIVVEISARIEDFMQFDRTTGKITPLQGEHFIADGKQKVRYDILAPNFRSMQKTWDLTSFWQNTYPEVRKELRGRYPKHPWPEKI